MTREAPRPEEAQSDDFARERVEARQQLLAAQRGGLTTVLIPEQNVKDLAEIPDNVKNVLDIRPVKWIDEVLQVALQSQPVPLAAAAMDVQAGDHISCALLIGGDVQCWGNNNVGQLGYGHTQNIGDNEPVSGLVVVDKDGGMSMP